MAYNDDGADGVLAAYFGFDSNLYFGHYEVIARRSDPEKYDSVRKIYEENLRVHPRRAEAAKRIYISDDFMVYLTAVCLKSDVQGLKKDSLFYYPICTYEEIKRIENISTAEDYLLKVRADCVADDPRMARVFLRRRERQLEGWSLTSYYDSYDFDEYISRLPAKEAEVCKGIASGYALSREPHGVCIKNEFGKVIVISESLRHFLFYMNAHFRGVREGLSAGDSDACFFIACRTMLLTETQDFDLDPRGELPDSVNSYCNKVVNDQLQFVIGHEYAHALLGHFGEMAHASSKPELLHMSQRRPGEKYFSPRQQQEFEADAGSILHADYSDEECSEILNAAVLFFLYLDVFYAISDYINPRFNPSGTHPEPIDRLWALRERVLSARTVDYEGLYTDGEVSDWVEEMQGLKKHLNDELLPFGIENFELYGSNYLPSFRKSDAQDRFDF